jgi:hypothetical protein
MHTKCLKKRLRWWGGKEVAKEEMLEESQTLTKREEGEVRSGRCWVRRSGDNASFVIAVGYIFYS